MDLLTEGVYDKGILKAVFMAGGPGSGKSYIASQLFGIPKKVNVSSFYIDETEKNYLVFLVLGCLLLFLLPVKSSLVFRTFLTTDLSSSGLITDFVSLYAMMDVILSFAFTIPS